MGDIKTISEKAKDALGTVLKGYINLLLDGLVGDGVLMVTTDPDKKTYRLKLDAPLEKSTSLPTEDTSMISSFNLFKDVLKNTYNHLHYGDPEKKQLTELISAFENRQVFKMPGMNIDRMKDLFDKSGSLLTDKEIQNDAAKLFAEQEVNFSAYISQLLEFYTQQKGSEVFKGIFIEKPEVNLGIPIDLIGRGDAIEFDLLFEIKFRKKPLETLQEDIVKAFDHLSQYNGQKKRDNWIIIVLYSDEGTTTLERIDYKFKQLRAELFPGQAPRMLILTIHIGNLHFVNKEFKKILQTIVSTKSSVAEFRFFNQPIHKNYPEIDDHYYERILRLEAANYRISITPQSQIDHWRVGLKFSNSENFPNRLTRHGPKFPIFHLEKNKDSAMLRVSYYNKTGKQQFAKTTRITEYSTQEIIITLAKEETIILDVRNSANESVLEAPFTLSGFNFAKLFAWGDNRNTFEIRALIEEVEK